MKLRIIIFCVFISSSASSFGQFKIPQVLKEAANAIKPGSPSQTEIGDAIKEMSVQDASNILLSDQKNAATTYFQRVTSKTLEAKFNPIVQSSLDKTQATKY